MLSVPCKAYRIFLLNLHGFQVICIRDRHNVRKLTAQLPPLEPGL